MCLGPDVLDLLIDATHAEEMAEPVRKYSEPVQTLTLDGAKAHGWAELEREFNRPGLDNLLKLSWFGGSACQVRPIWSR